MSGLGTVTGAAGSDGSSSAASPQSIGCSLGDSVDDESEAEEMLRELEGEAMAGYRNELNTFQRNLKI